MMAASRQFSCTVDGHNPEIIYHILEHQEEFGTKPSYQALDKFLRRKGTSKKQARLLMEAAARSAEDDDMSDDPSRRWEESIQVIPRSLTNQTNETNAVQEARASADRQDARITADLGEGEADRYSCVMKRLAARESVDLANDTDDILDRDYFNGVHQIYASWKVVRYMTDEKHGRTQNFSPQFDRIRRQLEANDTPMLDGPFDVLLPDPVTPGKLSRQRVILPHVYSPGWPGRPSTDLLEVMEWQRGIHLAEGRYHKTCLHSEGENPTLPEMVLVLGFASMDVFVNFIHRPDIKEPFRELWDAALKNVDNEKQLAQDDHERRPVALRILYSRGLDGDSEFDAKRPNKADWPLDGHLARFCLKVEGVCNREKLPPLRGQIPMLAGKVPTSVVAWGGIELARVLRRMQKGLGSRIRYLDQDPPM